MVFLNQYQTLNIVSIDGFVSKINIIEISLELLCISHFAQLQQEIWSLLVSYKCLVYP